MAVAVITKEGAVVMSGCAHSGLKNTLNYVQSYMFSVKQKIVAAIGGWHLFLHNLQALQDYGRFVKDFALEYFLASHCSGLETVHVLREQAPQLNFKNAINDTVGTQFVYDSKAKEKFSIFATFLNMLTGIREHR